MPPIRTPTCGENSATLHIPRHATPAKHVSDCVAAAARSSSCIVGQIGPASMQLTHFRPWPWCKLVSVCRIYVSRRRCVGRCVCCCSYGVVWGVQGGRGLPVRRHFPVGGKGWNYGGLIGLKTTRKQLKVKKGRHSRVYLGFLRPETGPMRFGPMAGLVRL